jgi:hypothetical protein
MTTTSQFEGDLQSQLELARQVQLSLTNGMVRRLSQPAGGI